MVGRPSSACFKFHFKPRRCKPIGWNIVTFIFQGQSTISRPDTNLSIIFSSFPLLFTSCGHLNHFSLIKRKKKRKPGARELISMLLNHTYKLHISYTYVSYIYSVCLRKTETLDLEQNNCNVTSLVQKGNNAHNNAIIKKSNSILTWELDNDLISFSHCWCQQILLSRQWEAKSHEVCWISQFPIHRGQGIYRDAACNLLGKTRPVGLLSIFGQSETKLLLYQKVIIFSKSIRIRLFLVLSRSDCDRSNGAGCSMQGRVGWGTWERVLTVSSLRYSLSVLLGFLYIQPLKKRFNHLN